MKQINRNSRENMGFTKSVDATKSMRGFTLIEVVLFLAISGAIFAMVMTGVSTSTARRRYNDSVNDLVEQIRNAYASTINVENVRTGTEDSSFFCSISSAYTSTGRLNPSSKYGVGTVNDNYPGRSRCAIYGQVITFGEQEKTRIYRYDVIGLAEKNDRNDYSPTDDDDVLDSLKEVGANIVTLKNNNSTMTSCSVTTAGTTSSYLPQWDAVVEDTSADRNLYKGAILIARSPISGTVHTFFYTNDTFEVQNFLNTYGGDRACSGFYNTNGYFVTEKIISKEWIYDQDLDICVGSEDLFGVANRRRAIRVHADGSTESAVELLSESESATVCKS